MSAGKRCTSTAFTTRPETDSEVEAKAQAKTDSKTLSDEVNLHKLRLLGCRAGTRDISSKVRSLAWGSFGTYSRVSGLKEAFEVTYQDIQSPGSRDLQCLASSSARRRCAPGATFEGEYASKQAFKHF